MPKEEGERRKRRSKAPAAEAVSTVNVYIKMEEVHAKLQMLNYEVGYLRPGGHAPLDRTHFAISQDSSAPPLFPQLLELVVYLFQLCHRDVAIDVYDEPMESVNKIVFELKTLGCEVEFQPQKLKTGYGEPAVQVLNFLCDQALAAEGVAFQQPVCVAVRRAAPVSRRCGYGCDAAPAAHTLLCTPLASHALLCMLSFAPP